MLLFEKAPVIAILRGWSYEESETALNLLQAAGFHTVEITMNTAHAQEIIAKLKEKFPDMNLGAGTVRSLEELDAAIAAGAGFIVTPVLNRKVIRSAVKQKITVFPGAFTPSEIAEAWDLGATVVKVFPASVVGPKYIKDILAPLYPIKLLPTGGISLGNIRSYFEAGATGVGMGSSLLDKKNLRTGNREEKINHLKAILDEISPFLAPH